MVRRRRRKVRDKTFLRAHQHVAPCTQRRISCQTQASERVIAAAAAWNRLQLLKWLMEETGVFPQARASVIVLLPLVLLFAGTYQANLGC